MNEFVLKKAIAGMANGVPEKVGHLKSGSIFIIVDKKTPKPKSIKDHHVD